MYAPFIGSPSSTASVGFLQFVFARAFPLKGQWWYPVVDEQHPVNPPSSYPISRQRSFNEQYISTAYEWQIANHMSSETSLAMWLPQGNSLNMSLPYPMNVLHARDCL
jgi:hypothetical protein